MPIHYGRRFPNLLANTVTRGDFEEFGRRIGLVPRLVKRELDMFATYQHQRHHDYLFHFYYIYYITFLLQKRCKCKAFLSELYQTSLYF